ncbi:unnamed protein product [Zymoseptoria tritici ST99CH_1A5]|uniref:RING-type E3 ubiquitin transferase n=1 Tax=Zymoseptoria tritici ST99CH_1A5 TaxID=1276529 RepID=A0A1Y6LZZ4_ZYMTR|nr:unnamed protein product [Zymoseptoria tritici ST99CH_3D1]SMY28998.1 unnamed protein product [Zymoseptoria tritici ST99CH_1A5]
MRLAYYAGASTAAAAACLLKAFHERPNFYSATVYLSQSNACLLILTNLLLILACSFMFALQRLLYGPLRPIEIEQLSEKAWYAVLDTLLAMPSFREDVGGWLLTMFVLLMAGKVWGWIGEGRVDVLEQQPPANPRLFHARLATSLIVSVIFDFYMLSYCIEAVIADPRPGMMVIFTFEFSILTIFSLFTLCRYGLSLYEAGVIKKQTVVAIEERKTEIRAERAAARQNETEEGRPTPASPPNEEPIEVDEAEVDVPGWEDKRRYLFMLEVLTDFIKLVIYLAFFTVSVTFNGLPMHIMRDVYMTFASFSKRVADYIAYKKATSDMNTRYPDATTEEIRGDSCIVCRENMVAWVQPTPQAEAQPAGEQPPAAPAPSQRRDEGLRAKKLPCGHILHLRCLKAWLERQQVCPTCRRPVVTAITPEVAAAAAGNNGGAQPGQPGQPGQPAAPRRGRARIFNFGPLRVGLLNGPNEQMRNILNQIQNPDGAANQNNAQAGANAQAPNANVQAGAAGATPNFVPRAATRVQVPLNIQLMQLEQRIMQEAYNLNLEQQQLANLRYMEGELSRLRAQVIPDQPINGISAGQRQANRLTAMTGIPFQHQVFTPSPPVPPVTLSGNAAETVQDGHESLPEGMVLPAGWSVMPLRRLGGDLPTSDSTAATVDSQSGHPSSSTARPGVPASALPTLPSFTADAAIPSLPATHTTQAPPSADAGMPTDERGSPLFVPTPAVATTSQSPATTTPLDSTASAAPTAVTPSEPVSSLPSSSLPSSSLPSTSQPPTSQLPTSQPPAHDSQAPSPWVPGSGAWSFEGPPDTNGQAVPATNSAETQQSSSEEQGTSMDKGKGKARAVELEEVPDPEA